MSIDLFERGCAVKRGKHPTTRRRKQLQRPVKRYMELREDLQLAGRIPVEPAGAVRDERVNPSVQGSQPLPDIAIRAIEGDRKGTWRVPAEKKPGLVDEMIGLVEAGGDDAPSPVVKVMAYNALVKGDQLQYERDHPEEAGRAKGGVNVTQQTQVVVDPFAMYQQAMVDAAVDPVEEAINEVTNDKPAEPPPA